MSYCTYCEKKLAADVLEDEAGYECFDCSAELCDEHQDRCETCGVVYCKENAHRWQLKCKSCKNVCCQRCSGTDDRSESLCCELCWNVWNQDTEQLHIKQFVDKMVSCPWQFHHLLTWMTTMQKNASKHTTTWTLLTQELCRYRKSMLPIQRKLGRLRGIHPHKWYGRGFAYWRQARRATAVSKLLQKKKHTFVHQKKSEQEKT